MSEQRSRHIEIANEIALGYEYFYAIRKRLNQHPDRNEAPLMPADVRLELVLNHLKSAVELLRREPKDGINLAFTQIEDHRERVS